jgi:hypothetical protein
MPAASGGPKRVRWSSPDPVSRFDSLTKTKQQLNEHAIYTQVARSNPRVLRVQPPLIVSAAQMDRFLEALRSTCAEWALLVESAEAILSKSAGEMGPR